MRIKFQSLIGTLKTSRDKPAASRRSRVSIPNRDAKNTEAMALALDAHEFQSLIGTLKTWIKGVRTYWCKEVSIPNRDAKNVYMKFVLPCVNLVSIPNRDAKNAHPRAKLHQDRSRFNP